MDAIKKRLSEYRLPLLIAAAQWFLTTVLQIDRLFFSYDVETSYYIIVKGLFLAFLAVAWCFGFHAARKIRAKDPLYTRGLHIFVAYFAILMALLVILWPGTWSWDDLWMLLSIRGYRSFHPWHHIITGMFQDVLLQILPFPGGLILLQNAIVALCVAYSVARLECAFHIQRLRHALPDMLLKLLPFLLPPVLLYQFSGYRIGPYVYFELALLVCLISACREDVPWGTGYMLMFCFLAVIVSTWRSEALVYIPFTCLLILLIKKEVLPRPKQWICIALIVAGFFGMNHWQNHEIGDSNYQVASLIRPCVELVRTADSEQDAAELQAIDRVIDLEVVRQNPSLHGEALYWDGSCLRNGNANPDDDYTDADYRQFLGAFVRLALKYPRVAITERWNLFLCGSGMTGESSMGIVPGAAYLFAENNSNAAQQSALSQNWLAYSPVFKNLRTRVINFLGGVTSSHAVNAILGQLWYNAVIPMLILLYAWFRLMLKKEWRLWLVCSAALAKALVVVLTEPSSMYMYYLSPCFQGYVCLAIILWRRFGADGGVKPLE